MQWKRPLIRLIRYLLISLGSFIAFVLVYLLIAYTLVEIPVNSERKPADDITIWIRTNGVHVDIVAPVKNQIIDWSKIVKPEYTRANDTTAKWVAFGWGDKGFYLQTPTWADLKFSVAFCAVTGLSEAAMHVTYFRNMNENDSCRKVLISKEEYKKLIIAIISGFDRTPSGEVIHIVTDANYNDYDAFYEARGTYSLFHTCNTWTNNSLRYAGLPCAVWTPFEKGLMDYYR